MAVISCASEQFVSKGVDVGEEEETHPGLTKLVFIIHYSIRSGQHHLLCAGVWPVLRVQTLDPDPDTRSADPLHLPAALLYLPEQRGTTYNEP